MNTRARSSIDDILITLGNKSYFLSLMSLCSSKDNSLVPAIKILLICVKYCMLIDVG